MKNNILEQDTLFDFISYKPFIKQKKQTKNVLSDSQIARFKSYTIEDYQKDVELYGLSELWDLICNYVLTSSENDLLTVSKFGELYEIGLAIENKIQKKNNGQYYTPEDVANVMSLYFTDLNGENICDVACGTGKLILTYLDLLGKEKVRTLILDKKLYLYDSDETALKICKTSILLKYGKDLEYFINVISGDFLSKEVKLPKNCKVISNPPYANIKETGFDWQNTKVLNDSKELYSCFMEKIITQSSSSVIITPYSFISGKKFYSLRQIMNNYNGEIYSFDNVPGNIFCGRKHGIFNTNTSNSVRAAITVVRSDNANGFKLTPLIRFKQAERNNLLKIETLNDFLSDKQQKITDKKQMFYKCFKQLQPLYDCLLVKAQNHTLESLVRKSGQIMISMPNTCRYYTTAFAGTLNRSGQVTLYFDDKDIFNYVFCLINSSFTYWHWRLFDGGINYPVSLLMKMPVIWHLLSNADKEFFATITDEMIKKAGDFIITKNNVGIQENIKYPRFYRDKINQRIVNILGIEVKNEYFDLIHSNMAMEINV